MTTRLKIRLRAVLSGGMLCLLAWSWPINDASACPEGGGTCPAASAGPASMPLGAPINVGAGNPINVMSGNKYQREEDMPALPGVLGLEIVRHYDSIHSGMGSIPGTVGRGWKLSYETRLLVASGGMRLLQADGGVANFSRDVLRRSVAVSGNPANGSIGIKRGNAGEEYLWRWPDGRELSFDRRGLLMQIKAASGEILSLLYDAQGLLVKVTDPQGRSLRLAYLDRSAARRGDRFRGVQSIDSPVGRFSYDHGSAAPKESAIDRRYLLASLVGVRDPAGDPVRTYHYEDIPHPTFLTGISKGGRRFATYGYNAAGKGVLSTHANDADKVTLDYARPGLTIVTNSLNQKTAFRYSLRDDDYRLDEVRGAGCALFGRVNMRYRYDRAGRLVESTELDAQGAPLQTARTERDYLGRPVRISRTVFGVATPPSPRQVARYEYADRDSALPTMIARPSVEAGKEVVMRIAYNRFSQPVSVVERGWTPAVEGTSASPLERTTRYRYRVVNGHSVLAEIDGPLPNGPGAAPADSDITRFEYDAGGSYLKRTVAPGNLVTEVRERDAALRPLLTVISDGVRLISSEEQLATSGQVVKRVESAWLLDVQGRPDAASRQVNTQEYRYDSQGQLQAELTPGHSMTRFRYDAADNLTHLIAADLSQVVRGFDTEGRMTAETRYGPGMGAGVVQRYAGDAAAGVVRLDGRIEQHWPDGVQPRTAGYQLAQPDTAAEGIVERVMRPDGSEVRRWFDDFGRVVATRSPERGLQVAAYDAADALVALRDALGVSVMVVRDARGRALEVRYADASGRPRQRMLFRYAGVVLAAEVRFEQGRPDSRVEWRSDVWGWPSGKLLAVYGADGQVAASMRLASDIDRERQVLRKTLASGAVVDYHYDAAGNVTRVELDGRPLLSNVRYAMTLGGLRPVSLDYGNGLRSETRYDAAGGLLTHLTGSALRWPWPFAALLGTAHAAVLPAVPKHGERRFSYDTHGRLIGEARGGRTVLAVEYNQLGDRVDADKAEVDAVGNVLSRGKSRLSYGASGDLLRVSDGGNGAVIADYRYDAQGQRVAKKTAGQIRYFMYDDGQLVAEANAAGRVVVEYIYLGRRPVARLRHDATASGGWFLGARADPVIEYLHTDQRDAVETMSDADGKLLWRGELDAFGALRSERGVSGGMPLRLSGQYADQETGLHYNVHRYYDPQAGRYLQADPLGLAAGMNMYAYVDSDPLNKSDPQGLSTESDEGGGIVRPWLFGTLVHNIFSAQVSAIGLDWGGNDGRNGTWTALRPDAYQVIVQPAGAYVGSLWELKPITWSSYQNFAKYSIGLAQVASYVAKAKGGCWSPGSGIDLLSKLKPPGTSLVFEQATWVVTYTGDTINDKSGLIFYSRVKQPQKPQPAAVPDPLLAPAEMAELDKKMKQIREQGIKEGWSTLEVIGMIVLIGVAIAAMVAVAIFAGTIAAVIASIGAALAAAAAGTVALMTALAAIFALGSAPAAAAETKGEEKQKGMLDSTISWFKSWF